MKENKGVQEGFIQIPLIWAIVVIASAVSIGAGVILYEKEKISSSSADVAEVSQRAVVVGVFEDKEIEKGKKEDVDESSPKEKEPKAEAVLETKKEKQRLARELDEARAEAERLEEQRLAEEEAQRLLEQQQKILTEKQEAQRKSEEESLATLEEERQKEIEKQQEINETEEINNQEEQHPQENTQEEKEVQEISVSIPSDLSNLSIQGVGLNINVKNAISETNNILEVCQSSSKITYVNRSDENFGWLILPENSGITYGDLLDYDGKAKRKLLDGESLSVKFTVSDGNVTELPLLLEDTSGAVRLGNSRYWEPNEPLPSSILACIPPSGDSGPSSTLWSMGAWRLPIED